ncbi:hypothetical protein Q5P01_006660 [Channa striata]|uniref:Uncharacterized protein n=1 Tax=Channa striata TaxID=64152 RepID=A0AA88T0Z3_CHASR|nr:hypothetical protein Q5P01_006660 [Channa striata]
MTLRHIMVCECHLVSLPTFASHHAEACGLSVRLQIRRAQGWDKRHQSQGTLLTLQGQEHLALNRHSHRPVVSTSCWEETKPPLVVMHSLSALPSCAPMR